MIAQYGVEGLSYEMVDGNPRLTEEALEHINVGDEDYMINQIGAAFGGSGNYFFEFMLTDRDKRQLRRVPSGRVRQHDLRALRRDRRGVPRREAPRHRPAGFRLPVRG